MATSPRGYTSGRGRPSLSGYTPPTPAALTGGASSPAAKPVSTPTASPTGGAPSYQEAVSMLGRGSTGGFSPEQLKVAQGIVYPSQNAAGQNVSAPRIESGEFNVNDEGVAQRPSSGPTYQPPSGVAPGQGRRITPGMFSGLDPYNLPTEQQMVDYGYSPETAAGTYSLLNQGTGAANIRELDPWSGNIHFEYQTPGEQIDQPNINRVPMDQNLNPDFSAQMQWMGPGPAPPNFNLSGPQYHQNRQQAGTVTGGAPQGPQGPGPQGGGPIQGGAPQGDPQGGGGGDVGPLRLGPGGFSGGGGQPNYGGGGQGGFGQGSPGGGQSNPFMNFYNQGGYGGYGQGNPYGMGGFGGGSPFGGGGFGGGSPFGSPFGGMGGGGFGGGYGGYGGGMGSFMNGMNMFNPWASQAMGMFSPYSNPFGGGFGGGMGGYGGMGGMGGGFGGYGSPFMGGGSMGGFGGFLNNINSLQGQGFQRRPSFGGANNSNLYPSFF